MSAKPKHNVCCWMCQHWYEVEPFDEKAPCPQCGAVHGWHEGYAPSEESVFSLGLAVARVKALETENAALRRQVEGLADRVAGQSELLARRAEK